MQEKCFWRRFINNTIAMKFIQSTRVQVTNTKARKYLFYSPYTKPKPNGFGQTVEAV